MLGHREFRVEMKAEKLDGGYLSWLGEGIYGFYFSMGNHLFGFLLGKSGIRDVATRFQLAGTRFEKVYKLVAGCQFVRGGCVAV